MKVNFLALQSRNPLKLIVSLFPPGCLRHRSPTSFHVQYAALPASYVPEISFCCTHSIVFPCGPCHLVSPPPLTNKSFVLVTTFPRFTVVRYPPTVAPLPMRASQSRINFTQPNACWPLGPIDVCTVQIEGCAMRGENIDSLLFEMFCKQKMKIRDVVQCSFKRTHLNVAKELHFSLQRC